MKIDLDIAPTPTAAMTLDSMNRCLVLTQAPGTSTISLTFKPGVPTEEPLVHSFLSNLLPKRPDRWIRTARLLGADPGDVLRLLTEGGQDIRGTVALCT